MPHRRLTLLLVVVCASVLARFSQLATATGYWTWMTAYDQKPTAWENLLDQFPSSQQCQLRHVSVVARHGVRTASKGQLRRARAVVSRLAQFVANETTSPTEIAKTTAAWSTNMTGGQLLLDKGRRELRFLAGDYYKLFEQYQLTRGVLAFTSSDTQRTRDSAAVFRQRWLNVTVNNDAFNLTIQEEQVSNELLRFFEECKRYDQQIQSNASSRPQFTDFPSSPSAVEVVDRLNAKLFGQDASRMNFTWGDYLELYFMAGYEIAITGKSSLEDLFSDDDLRYFDFYDDMETFWKRSGAAYPLSSKASCGLTSSIFKAAGVAGSQDDDEKDPQKRLVGSFHFGHSETIVPLFHAFGLLEDGPNVFAANASQVTIDSRKFRGSTDTPFAANIAFIFFDCKGDDNSTVKKMAVYLNGRQLKTWANVSELATKQPCLFNCDWHEFCAELTPETDFGIGADLKCSRAAAEADSSKQPSQDNSEANRRQPLRLPLVAMATFVLLLISPR